MSEMVIPSTYVDVRPEGLISAGRVATGIVAVVGTAADGPLEHPVALAGPGSARDRFGPPDDFDRPDDGRTPLTLTRALEQAYRNGATSIIAVRIAGPSARHAAFAVNNADGDPVAVLEARYPGSAGNAITVGIAEADEGGMVEDESHEGGGDSYRLDRAWVADSPDNEIRIVRDEGVQVLDLVYRRVVEDEDVAADADGRFWLGHGPVEDEESVTRIRVLTREAEVEREYGPGDILFGAGDAPDTGEVQITPRASNSEDERWELVFESDELPPEGGRVVATYAVDGPAPEPGQVLVTMWNGELEFAPDEEPGSGEELRATYLVHPDFCVEVILSREPVTERYVVPDGRMLGERVNTASALAEATPDGQRGAELPAAGVERRFGTGANPRGADGAEAGSETYGRGLERIANRLVNIVVLAGQDTSLGHVLLGHLLSTAETGHERIGLLGAPGETVEHFRGHPMADARVIVVAPGITEPDGSALPPAYTAAAVAGVLSSLPVEASLTNKAVNVPGLACDANRAEQAQLIRADVLALVEKRGFRVLKGITTAGEGTPFSAIPTRRIVDYAKYGVRSAADPYIGRLNNERVRSALKSTLDAFLTRMVEDEALTGYELEVSATRAQEIAGEVAVVMTIQPTFSIEFVKVTMVLK